MTVFLLSDLRRRQKGAAMPWSGRYRERKLSDRFGKFQRPDQAETISLREYTRC